MWYRDGKVAVTTGNKTIVGNGTLWLSQARQGDIFIGPDNGIYEITAVTDDTHINVKTVAGVEAYQGATLGNQNYSVIRNFAETTNADLAAKYVTLMNAWQTREDQFRAWHGGTLTGGWDMNGQNPGTGPYYPLTDAYGMTGYYKCPASLNQVGNADTLDTFHASQTPGAGQIPVVDSTGKTTLPGGLFTGTIAGFMGVRLEIVASATIVAGDASPDGTVIVSENNFRSRKGMFVLTDGGIGGIVYIGGFTPDGGSNFGAWVEIAKFGRTANSYALQMRAVVSPIDANTSTLNIVKDGGITTSTTHTAHLIQIFGTTA